MDKVKIDNNAFVYPLPMVLAGAMKLGSALDMGQNCLENNVSVSVTY